MAAIVFKQPTLLDDPRNKQHSEELAKLLDSLYEFALMSYDQQQAAL